MRHTLRRIATVFIAASALSTLAAPQGLPKPVIKRLAILVSEMVRAPEMRQKLFLQGWQVVGSSPEGLALRIKADTALLGGIIAAQGIQPN